MVFPIGLDHMNIWHCEEKGPLLLSKNKLSLSMLAKEL